MLNLDGEIMTITQVAAKPFSEEDNTVVVRVLGVCGSHKLIMFWNDAVSTSEVLNAFEVGQQVMINKGKPCDADGNVLVNYQLRTYSALSDRSGAKR